MGSAQVGAQVATEVEEPSFSVVGDWGLDIGDELTKDDLERMGVPRDVLTPLERGGSGESTSTLGAGVRSEEWGGETAPDAHKPNPYIFQKWKEKDGWRVNLWSDANHKIETKHNLNWKAVRATTRYPRIKVNDGGRAYKYETPVHHVTCSGWWVFKKCRVSERLEMRVIVDYRNHYDSSKGVVTAYCIGYQGACPSWVRNAVNI